MTDVVTRIVPKAYNGYMIKGEAPWVDSPIIDKYPTVHYGVITFDDVKMRADASEDDEANGVIVCDTQEQLEKALTDKCIEQFDAGVDKPSITIEVNMELLQNTELYDDVKELETVSLGDTAHCSHSKLEIVTDARAIELTWDAVRNKVTSVKLGDFQYNFLDNASSVMNRVEQAIREDGSVIGQQIQGIINGVQAQMRAQSSIAKKQEVRAILFEDLDPDSPTFGAMCLGTLGFEIAGERTADGRDWKWSTFGTGKGFYADFIVAGTMLADRIKGGTLELGGEDNGNGIARVMDATGKEIVRLDKDGVYAIGSYVCENVGGLNRRTEIRSGSIMFSKKDKSNPIFVESSGDAIVVRSGGTFDNATGSTTLLTISKSSMTNAIDQVYEGGMLAKTGRAEFSDGTYLDIKNGRIVGGNTKEGGTF